VVKRRAHANLHRLGAQLLKLERRVGGTRLAAQGTSGIMQRVKGNIAHGKRLAVREVAVARLPKPHHARDHTNDHWIDRQPAPVVTMRMTIAGLRLALPAEFAVDQVMSSWRAPAPTSGDPRVLQRQTTIRTSLIVHRREAGADASLEVLAGEVTAELLSSIGGLSGLTTETLTFADGAMGMVIGFDFGAPEVGTARQFHALRKDGTVLTTITLTVDKLSLNDANLERWRLLMSSAVIDGQGTLS
jgi:hypothetical protein